MSEIMPAGFYNMDCMEAMRQFPDKFFDLAIVDPPYGDGGQNIGGGVASADGSTGTRWNRFGQRFDRYKYQNPSGGITGSGPMLKNRGNLGGEIRQKNHSVGCCPGAGIFR